MIFRWSGPGIVKQVVPANMLYQTYTVNDPPVANAQSVATAAGTPRAITLSGSDANGDTLTYAIVTPPGHGTLSGIAPAITYTPAGGYSGDDSFTFKVNDGTVDSTTAKVSITVVAPDEPIYSVRSDGRIVASFVKATTYAWTVPAGVNSVEVLVVGGGGGGAVWSSGSGSGGLIYYGPGTPTTVVGGTSYPVVPGSHINVAVGAGGTAGTGSSYGTTGSPSSFGSLIAYGGYPGTGYTDGGDQGGHSVDGGTTIIPGNSGGDYAPMDGNWTSGGGAGHAGYKGDSQPGGIGLQYSITGTPSYYAGGGGANANGPGGLGGGGKGADNMGGPAYSGTAGTGGGGGGGWGGTR